MNARWLAPLVVTVSFFVAGLPAALAQAGDSVLLLGVQRAGKVDPKLTKSLRDALTKGGETLVKENALAGPERLCSNEACLSQLASREGARAVLGAQLDAAPGSTSPYIIMLMYDADRRASSEERTICDKCTPPQTVAALVDLAHRLLKDARAKRDTAPSSPTSGMTGTTGMTGTAGDTAVVDPNTQQPGTTPATATSLPLEAPPQPQGGDFFSRWPKKRKIAAGVLAGLLVATLIPTIALFATDGQDTSLISCTGNSGFCKLQNKPLWAAGFGISGALAIGIGITFAWPQPKSATPSPAIEIPSLPAESK